MTDFGQLFAKILVALLILACGFVAGCTTGSSPAEVAATPTPLPDSSVSDHVEVIHFHGNHQCESCITLGNLAEATVKANFRDELASGKLVFAHVNAELPENAVLAKKYGVTGSSLWIGVYNSTGFHKEEDIRVWYLIKNNDAYSSYLSGVITKRLNGDLS